MYECYVDLPDDEKVLTSADRNKLVEIIIDGLFGRHESVKSSMLKDIAQDLVHIFKKEKAEVYFCPKTGNMKAPGGKLYIKYNNEKHRTRKRKRSSSACMTAPAIETLENSDEIEEARKWLLYSNEPWREVEVKWQETFKYRKIDIEKGDIKNAIDRWAILKDPRSFALVSLDFS